jgi:RHS repeat-associated protein
VAPFLSIREAGVAVARSSSVWSVAWLSTRLRRAAPVLAVVVAGALVASTPAPAAAADPVLPAGATLSPPRQRTGSAAALGSATADQTQGGRGPGAPTAAGSDDPGFLVPLSFTQPGSGADAPVQSAAVLTAIDATAAGAGSTPGLQAGAFEDVTARTWDSMEFVNPDGSRQRRVFEDLRFVAAADGSMVPMDNTLRSQASSGWLAPAASVSQASFAPVSDGSTVARLDPGDGVSVGFGVDGSATVRAWVAGSVATYANVRPGADLRLSATRYGLKDDLVLRSANAPTTWLFPLKTDGASPSWDPQSGQVDFVDRHGNVVATIPPGFMEDSSKDPHSGGPAVSTHVSQTLIQQGDGWVLRMELDPAWLADPARVWPVIMDPTMYYANVADQDTFVSTRDYAGVNNAGNTELKIGTYDGGGEVDASYLKFGAALAGIPSPYIQSGGVYLYNTWSYSCSGAPVEMHAVTDPNWNTANPLWWPGPSFETDTFTSPVYAAFGYTTCPAGGFVTLPIDGSRLTAWKNGLENFYGVTVRASETDSHGWKRFWSSNYTGDQNKWPYLYINYVPGAPTYLQGVLPTPGGTVDTLTPTLNANYFNPTGTNWFKFKVCNGTPPSEAGCSPETGWLTSPTYQVPAGAISSWNKPWFWELQVSNGYAHTNWMTFTSTSLVTQPGVTAHLAGAPEGSEMPGVNPQPGNYATTVTDAAVSVAGPALSLTRTYNSQDIRTDGAFGPGWSTPWDQRLVVEADGTGNVLLTQPTGLQARLGRNPDGSYSPPLGQTLDVKQNTDGSWTVRDPSGYRRTFDPSGRIASVIDPNQRTQLFAYDAYGHVTAVTDAASGRALHVTWTGTALSDHIATVSTDPPASGQSALTWSYSYTGGVLSQVCTPLAAGSCTAYNYNPYLAPYRSVVLNDNPAGYWTMSETSGTTMANIAALNPGDLNASAVGVSLGAAGMVSGSPDPAGGFNAGSNSRLELPQNTFNTTNRLAMEVWFRTGTGQGGVLFGEQDQPMFAANAAFIPNLYVGTDGLLHALFMGSASPLVSARRVDDNLWHQAVVSASDAGLTLYLDGNPVSFASGSIQQGGLIYNFIGDSDTNGVYEAAVPTGSFPFTGTLDEAAFYRHPLSDAQVLAHYRATVGSTHLSSVVEPGSFTAVSLTYDPATSRVTSLVDRNGATWTLSAPSLVANPNGQSDRQVTLSSSAYPTNTITYTYATAFGGRVRSRGDSFGTKQWTYGNNGFLSSFTDENGNTTNYATDARGNVTSNTICRVPDYCQTNYTSYYPATDPFDPRTDATVSTSDPRAPNGTDPVFQTSITPNGAAQPTLITYPVPAGQSAHPTESFTYSTGAIAGLLLSKTGRTGGITTNTYNSHGDLLTSTDPVGLVTTYTYDDLGRVTSVNTSATVGGSHVDYGTTTTTYNGLSRPLVVTAPSITNPITGVTHRAVTTLAYDTAGRRTSQAISDATGGDATRTTTWGYDPAGRLTSTTNPDGTVTTQGWNNAGDVASATKPGGLALSMTYDAAHRLLTTTANGTGVDPENPSATSLLLDSRSYDLAGRLYEVQDAMGRTTRHSYYKDNLPSVTTAVLPDPTPAVDLEIDEYDAAGHLGPLTEAGARSTAAGYDPAGNLSDKVFDWNGVNRKAAYTYNPDSSVASVSSSVGGTGRTERVDHTYDLAGRDLTSTVDNSGGSPAALTTTLVRDPRGLVTSTIDPSGIATTMSYDLTGQLVTTTGAARTVWVNGTSTAGVQPVSTTGRNTFGEATQQQDANGNTTSTAYDSMGRPTSVTLPAYTPPGGSAITATATTTYNALGLPATRTDAAGHVTTYTYDKYGRVLTRTDPDPDGAGPKTAPVWTYTYDRDGELLDSVDPTGAHTSSTYDERGRKITSSVSDHNGATLIWYTTTYTVDDAGNTTAVSTPSGHVTTTVYDKAGEPTTVTDPTGRFTQTTYDLAGRVTSTVHGQNTTYANPVTTTSYDLAGRAVSTSDCTATSSGACNTVIRTATTAFDGAGRTIQATTAAGRPTYYGYDTAGQLATITQRVDPTNAATAITVNLGYDRDGNKTRMIDGNGNPTTYTYNTWNLPESTIEASTTPHPDPVDRTWTTTYNTVGLSTQDTLPGGATRTRTYDALNRLTGETGTGAEASTTARSLDYDPLGRVVSATSPAGNLTFTYTERGQLATATGYGGASTYTYNADNLPTGRTDTAGAATFGYDTAGRLTTVVDPLSGTTSSTTYDPAGRASSISYGASNPTRTYTYDNLGRPATDTTTKPGGTVSASIAYGYDLDNLLTAKTTTGLTGAGANTYTYDGLSRVTGWLNPAGTTSSYGYDAASNRTTLTTPAGTRTSTYDQRNRIQSTTGAGQPDDTYAFNARGELTTATRNSATTTYTYDAFDRLTQAAKSPGTTTTYTYDSLDRAAQRNTTNFAYNDLTNNPISTPAASGETKLLRDLTGKPLTAKTGTSAANLLLGDLKHGDIDAAFDPTTGNLGPSTNYDPWGAATSVGTVPPVGFQGGYTDPDTGLVNAHARWYDPTLGEFTGRDTLTLTPNPIAQANRYLYANNSPLNGRDPDGHRLACQGDDGATHACATNEWGAPSPAAQSTTYAQARHAAQVEQEKINTAATNACNHSSECGPGATPFASERITPYVNQVYQYYLNLFDESRNANYPYYIGDQKTDAVNATQAYFDQKCAQGIKEACVPLAEQEQGPNISGGPDCDLKCVELTLLGFLISAVMLSASLDGGVGILGAADKEGALGKLADAVKKGSLEDILATSENITQKDVKNLTPEEVDAGIERAASCKNSFSPDTPVLVSDGASSPISHLRPGDQVVATDTQTGQTARKTITALHINEDTALVDVDIVNSQGKVVTIHTTQNHLFWDNSAQTWTPAGNLQPGHGLLAATGTSASVVAVRAFAGRMLMYNLTIADTHTYYVVAGTTPVLVHNTCGGNLGDDWVQRPPSEITGSFGCEACADEIIERLGGGERIVITPTDTPYLGTYRGVDTAWAEHTAVLYNGRVYDAFGPADGVPLVDWLKLWGPGAAVRMK